MLGSDWQMDPLDQGDLTDAANRRHPGAYRPGVGRRRRRAAIGERYGDGIFGRDLPAKPQPSLESAIEEEILAPGCPPENRVYGGGRQPVFWRGVGRHGQRLR